MSQFNVIKYINGLNTTQKNKNKLETYIIDGLDRQIDWLMGQDTGHTLETACKDAIDSKLAHIVEGEAI